MTDNKLTYWDDPTAKGDQVAEEMRDYYEAHKPLRWRQKRKRPGSWGGNADNLMIGLLNIAAGAYAQQEDANDD